MLLWPRKSGGEMERETESCLWVRALPKGSPLWMCEDMDMDMWRIKTYSVFFFIALVAIWKHLFIWLLLIVSFLPSECKSHFSRDCHLVFFFFLTRPRTGPRQALNFTMCDCNDVLKGRQRRGRTLKQQSKDLDYMPKRKSPLKIEKGECSHFRTYHAAEAREKR